MTTEKLRKLIREAIDEVLNESCAACVESNERPYICVHSKKGKYEVKATSSYQAAQKAAQKWGLKSTAGIDAYLSDVTHTPTNENESSSDVEEPENEPGRGWETDVGAKKDPRELDPTDSDYDPDEFREWLNMSKNDPAVQLVLKEYVGHKDKTKTNTILLNLYKKKNI